MVTNGDEFGGKRAGSADALTTQIQ